MMGIPSVEDYAGQTITIRWWNILCIGPRQMIVNHYSGLGPWQWYHTHKATLDGATFCMSEDASHNGDTQCWWLCRANHHYPVVKHALNGFQMDDNKPLQLAWTMVMVPHTQSHTRRSQFWYVRRRKSQWGYLLLRVMQGKPSLSGGATSFIWVPHGW